LTSPPLITEFDTSLHRRGHALHGKPPTEEEAEGIDERRPALRFEPLRSRFQRGVSATDNGDIYGFRLLKTAPRGGESPGPDAPIAVATAWFVA
jgi:hypothetical protein